MPEGFYTVDEGKPAIRHEGSDLTIITVATMFHALTAAEELQTKTVSARK